MSFTAEGFNPLFDSAIQDAASDEWDFDNFDHDIDDKGKHYLYATGDANLCGGEGEEEFSKRLTHAIWKANRAFCEVNVQATDLDELPNESYSLDEDDYTNFIGQHISDEDDEEPEVIDPNEECKCGLLRSACDYHKRS